MDCARVASGLVAYWLATCSEEERDAIDAHLLECRSCLRSFLALKRAQQHAPPPPSRAGVGGEDVSGEAEAATEPRPSPAVRARLRAEVARRYATTVDPSPLARTTPLLQRRIPLYQGLVAVALAAAIALFLPVAFRRVGAGPSVREGVPEVDTSRPRAESLHIY